MRAKYPEIQVRWWLAGVAIRAQIRGLERAWRPLTALRASGRIGEKVPCSYATAMISGYVNIFVTVRKFQSSATIFVTATGVSNGPVVGTKRSLSLPALPGPYGAKYGGFVTVMA